MEDFEKLLRMIGNGNHELISQITDAVGNDSRLREIVKEYIDVSAALDHWTAVKGADCLEAGQYQELATERMEEILTILHRDGILPVEKT